MAKKTLKSMRADKHSSSTMTGRRHHDPQGEMDNFSEEKKNLKYSDYLNVDYTPGEPEQTKKNAHKRKKLDVEESTRHTTFATWKGKVERMGWKMTKDNKKGVVHAWDGTSHKGSYNLTSGSGSLDEAKVGDKVKFRNIKTKRMSSGIVRKVSKNQHGANKYELDGGKIIYDQDIEEAVGQEESHLGKSRKGFKEHIEEAKKKKEDVADKGKLSTIATAADRNAETGSSEVPDTPQPEVSEAHVVRGGYRDEEVEDIVEVKLAAVMKKIRDGEWEASSDVKPGRSVEIRNTKTGKRRMIMVEAVQPVDEALTSAQRRAKARQMKKYKSRIKIGREKAMRRMASKETLERRARKAARKVIFTRLTKGKSKEELPFQRRQEIEKRLDKMGPRIDQIARKMLPKVRKKELERKRGSSKPKND